MKVLFWDIETAPTQAWVWKMWKENISPAQIIEPGHVLCWSAAWEGDDDVTWDAVWESGQAHCLRNLHKLLSEADVNVSYNGDHFDLPTVNAAFLKYGLAPPPPSQSVDLYQVVKKKFRLLSNRMDYIAKMLGHEGKKETGGFELWSKVMEGDVQAREKMVEYNIQDIEVLEFLYYKLLPWIPKHPQRGHFSDDDHCCPTCGSINVQKRGFHRTKVYSYQRYQCLDCGAWSRERLRDKEQPVNALVGV